MDVGKLILDFTCWQRHGGSMSRVILPGRLDAQRSRKAAVPGNPVEERGKFMPKGEKIKGR